MTILLTLFSEIKIDKEIIILQRLKQGILQNIHLIMMIIKGLCLHSSITANQPTNERM